MYHLLPITKEKILRGEFMNLFALLYREPVKKGKEEVEIRDKEILKKCKVEKTLANWLPGYLIHIGS